MATTKYDIEFLITSACQEVVSEKATYFDSLDTSDVTLSSEADRKFIKRLNRVFFRESRAYKILKTAVVSVLIALALALVVVVAVEPFINHNWKLRERTSAGCVGIELETEVEEGFEYPKHIIEAKLPKIKEGWKIEAFETVLPIPSAYTITTDDGKLIYYSIHTVYGESFIDNGKHTVEEVVLANGQKAVVITYEYGYCLVIWQEKNRYEISSHDIEKDVLIELAGTVE